MPIATQVAVPKIVCKQKDNVRWPFFLRLCVCGYGNPPTLRTTDAATLSVGAGLLLPSGLVNAMRMQAAVTSPAAVSTSICRERITSDGRFSCDEAESVTGPSALASNALV